MFCHKDKRIIKRIHNDCCNAYYGHDKINAIDKNWHLEAKISLIGEIITNYSKYKQESSCPYK
jgi:hypothetical protein